MAATSVRWLLLGLLLAGCAAVSGPTVAPAAADRPQIWFVIINRSDMPARLDFEGETRRRPGSSTIEFGPCAAGAWNVPIEDRWTASLNGMTILESGATPLTADSVARLEVRPDGSPRLVTHGPGHRPGDPPQPDC